MGQWSRRITLSSDEQGNIDSVCRGPFWPKNNFLGMGRWIQVYVSWVEQYFLHKGKPHIIHAHTYLGALIAHEVKKKHQIPYLVTEHYTGWMDGTIRKSHKLLAKKAFKNADLVSAVSPALRDVLIQEVKVEVKVIPNFIDTGLFAFDTDHQYRNHHALCIGDLIERKQVNVAIEVVMELNNRNKPVNLTIVGSGPKRKTLQQLINDSGLNTQVQFVGQKNKKEVAALLKSGGFMIHTSKLETFGLVIAEALCCGLRVFSFDNKGVNAMSGIPGLHIIKEMSPSLMADSIVKIMDQPELDRKSFSKQACAMLAVGAIVTKLSDAYSSLLV